MIDEVLLDGEAARSSIRISDGEVESAIERSATESGKSRDLLMAEAMAAGMPAREFREHYRRQILEWRVLYGEYGKKHNRSLPGGEEASRAYAAWRSSWLKDRRQAACIERRLSAH
jgi:hypothetical protein